MVTGHIVSCLAARRQLLAAGRTLTREIAAHVRSCRTCTQLLLKVQVLDRKITDAAWVAPPDAIADRVLLAQRHVPVWRYGAAAGFALISIVAGLFGGGVIQGDGFERMAERVGPTHPAVTAIEQVINASPARRSAANSIGAEERLKRLGLVVKSGEATAEYVGKCRLPGAGRCEEIVLSTPREQANVLLMPDYPVSDRMVVADHGMVAVVSPAAHGGYVIVAQSRQIARRLSKLLVEG